LEEKRERLTGGGGDIDIERTASEILPYIKNADKVFAKATPQEKKVFVRQFVAVITIDGNKSEGILALYSFPVMGHFGHPEGTDCTFTGNFRKAKIMKGFSCETGVTLEMIGVNQAR